MVIFVRLNGGSFGPRGAASRSWPVVESGAYKEAERGFQPGGSVCGRFPIANRAERRHPKGGRARLRAANACARIGAARQAAETAACPSGGLARRVVWARGWHRPGILSQRLPGRGSGPAPAPADLPSSGGRPRGRGGFLLCLPHPHGRGSALANVTLNATIRVC